MEEAIILIYHDQKLRRGPPPDTERTRSQRGDRITANMLKDNPGVGSNAILTRLPRRETTIDGRWTRKPFGVSSVQPSKVNNE